MKISKLIAAGLAWAGIASAVFGYNYLHADWSKAYDDSRDQPIQPTCFLSIP